MKNKFVPAAEAYRKLKVAESCGASVYIYGATGYGKTKLVEEYLKDRESVWLSSMSMEWNLSEILNNKSDKKICIVIDDMQLLTDEEQKSVLLNLAKQKNIWLIMIGRMQTPTWLISLIADGHLIVILEENLHLSANEVKLIAQNEDVELDDETAEIIADNGNGNAYVATSIIQLIKSGEEFNDNLKTKILEVFVNHLEINVIPQWSINLQEFLMQVSVVDEFTIPLAVMITGDNHAPLMLEQALGAGNFLIKENDIYRIRPQLIRALRNRAVKVFGVRKYNQYINNAGLYYETQNDYSQAIKLYEMSDNKDGVRSLLIRSARRHPGTSNIHELRHYYLALEEKDIETSPVLISVMSMLYSIMMNPEKSEYWYEKLKNYAQSAKGGEKREAREQLLYLDIALPHRGSVNLLDILKNTAGLLASGGLKLPEMSLTNNQPSTMNGGKDFCSWSKRDKFLADTVGKLIEKMLGNFGRGLIHAALSESFYEKGGRDDEVIHHAIMLQMQVESGGKTELFFTSIGIQIRLHLLSGNTEDALKLLNSFEERAKAEKLNNLLPNISALRCRIALVMEDIETVNKWLDEEAPNEHMEFWSLDRYRYLTKVRCYLALGRNADAINLLQRLLYYADISHRTYIRMESNLFMAMALRQEKREWKQIFSDVINEIHDYSFVRIISEKGAGILPLLKAFQNDYLEQENSDKSWYNNVLKETKQLAERYPGYLVCDTAQPKDFCETAMTILKMQAKGMSMKAIADKLCMGERTVKYHAAENYRKLGAKGKTDAVQIAKSLKLI